MKMPNPFLRPETEEEIIGMKEEVRALDGFINRISAGQAPILMVHGVPGSGRSALLKHMRTVAERQGISIVFIHVEHGENIEELARRIFNEAIAPVLPYKKKTSDFTELLDTLPSAARKGSFGNLLILDDIDSLRKSEESLKMLLVSMAGSSHRVALVMSSTRAFRINELPTLELLPIDETQAKDFVAKALKDSHMRMGDECISTILADTGGNPRLFRDVCMLVYDSMKEHELVISQAHYLSYLPSIMAVLSMEWFGALFQKTPKRERAILSVMAQGDENGMHVSDISRKVGRPMGETTALMGRLLDSGQVVRIDRGTYRIFAGLYAKYVMQRS